MSQVKVSTIRTMVDQMNESQGIEKPYYRKKGAFVLDEAYSGYQLQRYYKEGESVVMTISSGYKNKKEIYDFLFAYRANEIKKLP